MADVVRHYAVLGLTPSASQDQVKQAYYALAKRWHPDLALGQPELQRQALDKMKEINAAYEVLQSYKPASRHAGRSHRPVHDAPRTRSTDRETEGGRGPGSGEIDLQTRRLERLYLEAEERRRRLRNGLCCECGLPLTRLDKLRKNKCHVRCEPNR